MRAYGRLLSGLLVAILAMAPPAFADDDDRDRASDAASRHERAAERRRVGELLPLGKILEKLHQRFTGKVLEIEFEDEQPPVYEFYVLQPSGRVIEVEFDARTGKLLKSEIKD